MKEKDITLLSGNDKDNYWNIFIRINENGDFNVLRGIRVRDKDDKGSHNKASRKYAKKHKRKNVRRKGFTLIQGNEDEFHWNITTTISENGSFDTKGRISITDNTEKRVYVKLYR